MDVQSLVDWFVRLGATGTMAMGLVALHRRWFVHAAELDRMVADRNYERARAEKAEEKLMVAIPALKEAATQVSRAPDVAEKAIQTAAEVAKTVKGAGGS